MTRADDGTIVVLGAGAVGCLVGGLLAEAGRHVVLIDGWAEHVEAIRARGLRLDTPEGERVARPQAWHLGEASRLRRLAPKVAFLTVKLYDTDWSARLLANWLDPAVPVVSLQNALVEEVVARAVGWGRTLGAIGGGLDVAMVGAGHMRRSRRCRSGDAITFKVGEMNGRRTPRAAQVAALLDEVDRAAVTTDLWTERWAKLCANVMTTGLSGITGSSLKAVYTSERAARIAVHLAAEALEVCAALGFERPSIFGLDPGHWRAAAGGDTAAMTRAVGTMAAQAASMTDDGMSGTLQDLRRQRPTEVDYFNGFIAREGERAGVAVPLNARLAALIREIERGERAIAADAIEHLATAHAIHT
ncbi:MAG: ketopantoate reductase family protein [Lautropia sp.]